MAGVLIDPSVLLVQPALDESLAVLAQLRGEDAPFEFYLPPTLLPALEGGDTRDLMPFFTESDAERVDPQAAAQMLRSAELPSFERPGWASQEFSEFYGALGAETPNAQVQETVFDEWFFLTHESWVVAKLKSAFTAMARAGELAVEALDQLTRRTLKKHQSDVLTTANRLQALGKWLAVGGTAGGALLGPLGTVLSAVSGGFLLLDPP